MIIVIRSNNGPIMSKDSIPRRHGLRLKFLFWLYQAKAMRLSGFGQAGRGPRSKITKPLTDSGGSYSNQ